jgi:hypothetical protein
LTLSVLGVRISLAAPAVVWHGRARTALPAVGIVNARGAAVVAATRGLPVAAATANGSAAVAAAEAAVAAAAPEPRALGAALALLGAAAGAEGHAVVAHHAVAAAAAAVRNNSVLLRVVVVAVDAGQRQHRKGGQKGHVLKGSFGRRRTNANCIGVYVNMWLPYNERRSNGISNDSNDIQATFTIKSARNSVAHSLAFLLRTELAKIISVPPCFSDDVAWLWQSQLPRPPLPAVVSAVSMVGRNIVRTRSDRRTDESESERSAAASSSFFRECRLMHRLRPRRRRGQQPPEIGLSRSSSSSSRWQRLHKSQKRAQKNSRSLGGSGGLLSLLPLFVVLRCTLQLHSGFNGNVDFFDDVRAKRLLLLLLLLLLLSPGASSEIFEAHQVDRRRRQRRPRRSKPVVRRINDGGFANFVASGDELPTQLGFSHRIRNGGFARSYLTWQALPPGATTTMLKSFTNNSADSCCEYFPLLSLSTKATQLWWLVIERKGASYNSTTKLALPTTLPKPIL